MTDRRPSEQARNAGTMIALGALVLAGFAMLGLVSIVLPKAAWLVVVVFGFVLMGLFHYVTWGRWLSSQPFDDDENEEDSP